MNYLIIIEIILLCVACFVFYKLGYVNGSNATIDKYENEIENMIAMIDKR